MTTLRNWFRRSKMARGITTLTAAGVLALGGAACQGEAFEGETGVEEEEGVFEDEQQQNGGIVEEQQS